MELSVKTIVALILLITLHKSNLWTNKEQVRISNKLCTEELQTWQARFPRIHKTLQQFTQTTIQPQQCPTLGIVSSGGGFHAAVATLGLLQGLEEIGLLDGIWAMSTLSGSTWLTSAWLKHGYSLAALEKFLRLRMNNAFCHDLPTIKEIVDISYEKVKEHKSFSLNDIWGKFLGKVFLDNDQSPEQHYLHETAHSIADGNYPFPLFSSVVQKDCSSCFCLPWTSEEYNWMEFSPFEVGVIGKSCWVPTSAFGNRFNNGVSNDAYPPESWDFLLGTWGAAYAISPADTFSLLKEYLVGTYKNILSDQKMLLDITISSTHLKTEEQLIPQRTSIFNWRISPPQVHNFMYNVKGNSFNQQRYLEPLDAGLDIKVPFPPLLRRNIDIYIVCDASSDRTYGNGEHSLSQTKRYAKKHGYQFPAFNEDNIRTKPISLIIDQKNPTAPIIIYLPSSSDASMFDFDYDDEQFSGIINNMRSKVIEHADYFKKAVTIASIKNNSVRNNYSC